MIDNTQLLSKLTGLLYMLELNFPYEIGLSYWYKIHEWPLKLNIKDKKKIIHNKT